MHRKPDSCGQRDVFLGRLRWQWRGVEKHQPSGAHWRSSGCCRNCWLWQEFSHVSHPWGVGQTLWQSQHQGTCRAISCMTQMVRVLASDQRDLLSVTSYNTSSLPYSISSTHRLYSPTQVNSLGIQTDINKYKSNLGSNTTPDQPWGHNARWPGVCFA